MALEDMQIVAGVISTLVAGVMLFWYLRYQGRSNALNPVGERSDYR